MKPFLHGKIHFFTLTEDHLKLLNRMYVGWSDCEYGAPEIDPKRPYGNSWVVGDIHEILNGESCEYYDLDDTLEDKYNQLHSETEIALQIILCTGSFEPGVYVKSNIYDDRSWKLKSE